MRSSPAQKPTTWTVRRPMLERAMVFGGLLLAVALAGVIDLPVLPRPAHAAAAVLLTDTSVPTDPTSVATPPPTAAAEPTPAPSPTVVEPSATPPDATAPIVTPSAEPTAETTPSPTATPAATEPAEPPTATPSEIPATVQPPAETPTPTAAPTATPNAGEPPLVLTKRASHPQVAPGATFNYLLRVETTSAAPLSVRVRDQLDPQVQAVGAAASSGSCVLGAVVQCSIRVARDTPATLQISVQVRSDVAPGSVVISQATARDEANNAASSEPVAVAVIELNSSGAVAPTPSGTPAPPPMPPRVAATPEPTTTPVPSGRITGTVIELSSGAPAAGIAVRVGDSTVRTDSAGNYRRAGLPPGVYEVALALEPGQGQQVQEPLHLALGPGATVVQHLSFMHAAPAAIPPALGPTVAATASPTAAPVHGAGSALPRRVAPPARSGVSLPATAGIPVVAALVVGLLGLGLTVRALRRTRAAGALLADQSRLVGELAPLLRAAIRRQRAADSALLAMRRQSEHIAELLDRTRKR